MSGLLRKTRSGHSVKSLAAGDWSMQPSLSSRSDAGRELCVAAVRTLARLQKRNDAKVKFIPRSLPVNSDESVL